MKLHPKLEPFKATKNVKIFNKLLLYLENDLKAADVADFEVDVWERERPQSALKQIKKMLAWERNAEAHQIMFVSGGYQGRVFTVGVPLRNARSIPYTVQVELPVQIDFVANYVRASLGKKWKIVEGRKEVLAKLKQFEMPKIAWKHSSGGYSYRVYTGATLAPSDEDASLTIWSIQSGFQGSIVSVGPRCAHYLMAVGGLEGVLAGG